MGWPKTLLAFKRLPGKIRMRIRRITHDHFHLICQNISNEIRMDRISWSSSVKGMDRMASLLGRVLN